MILDTQPVVSDFFSHALRAGSLAHAYLFTGNQYDDMYRMAMNMARILNCDAPPQPDEACGQCQNCRWIAQNAHPSVMTISRMTFLTEEPKSDSPEPPEFLTPEKANSLAKKGYQTQIKVGQVERLIYQLGLHAKDYRVVIFTDTDVLPADHPSDLTAPYEWRDLDVHADKSLHIRPLSSDIFNRASANRFLKTLEEPPPKTLFFFIAESETHLLDTIVSRCQVVPFQRKTDDGPAVSPEHRQFLEQLMGSLRPKSDFYHAQALFEAYFTEQQSLTAMQALGIFQRYLQERLHGEGSSPERFARYRTLQRKLEHAQNLLDAKTHPHQTLNQLFLELTTVGGF